MSEDGFLSRWSRRKRAAEAGRALAEPDSPPAVPAATHVAAPQAAEPAPQEPPFDPTSLPPLDSLTAESDFGAFLRKGVPAALRHAALRKAWSLDPAIRDFVGPADYAWDFNAPDGVPGFGLDLPGDVQRMAARVLGLDDEERAERPGPRTADAATQAALGPYTAPPQPAAAADPAPATPDGIEAPTAAEQPAETGEDGLIAHAPRRHGSALPA
jgi:hypothetical protein